MSVASLMSSNTILTHSQSPSCSKSQPPLWPLQRIPINHNKQTDPPSIIDPIMSDGTGKHFYSRSRTQNTTQNSPLLIHSEPTQKHHHSHQHSNHHHGHSHHNHSNSQSEFSANNRSKNNINNHYMIPPHSHSHSRNNSRSTSMYRHNNNEHIGRKKYHSPRNRNNNYHSPRNRNNNTKQPKRPLSAYNYNHNQYTNPSFYFPPDDNNINNLRISRHNKNERTLTKSSTVFSEIEGQLKELTKDNKYRSSRERLKLSKQQQAYSQPVYGGHNNKMNLYQPNKYHEPAKTQPNIDFDDSRFVMLSENYDDKMDRDDDISQTQTSQTMIIKDAGYTEGRKSESFSVMQHDHDQSPDDHTMTPLQLSPLQPPTNHNNNNNNKRRQKRSKSVVEYFSPFYSA
eukprot:100420_1